MKRTIAVFLGFLMMVTLVGCNSFPEMTQEQESQIVNYAAAVALKYDGNYENRLVDLSLYDEVKIPDASVEEEEEEPGMDPVEDTDTIDRSEGTGYHSSMEEFFGIDGITIEFDGCYFADSYPEGSVQENYFTLDASKGKKLLVMQFAVTNVSEKEILVDFFSVAPELKISLNGDTGVKGLSTILTDDLSVYKETMKKGEAVNLVLLAEISSEKATEIQKLDLTMKNGSETAKILLK